MLSRTLCFATVLLSSIVMSAPLSQQQLLEYEQNGFLLIRHLYTADIVREMTSLAEQAVQDAYTLSTRCDKQKGDIKRLENGTQYVFDGASLAIKRIVWIGGAYPELLSIGRSRSLTEPVYKILQVDALEHLINQLHPKIPIDGVEFGFHRDFEHRFTYDKHWKGAGMHNGGFVQTLVAIDPVNRRNGGIEIYPGSHRSAEPLKDIRDQKWIEKQLRSRYPLAFYPELEPGDALFFHPNVAHRSMPNQSTKPRRVFINGFSAPGANQGFYPGTGSGERIHKDW